MFSLTRRPLLAALLITSLFASLTSDRICPTWEYVPKVYPVQPQAALQCGFLAHTARRWL